MSKKITIKRKAPIEKYCAREVAPIAGFYLAEKGVKEPQHISEIIEKIVEGKAFRPSADRAVGEYVINNNSGERIHKIEALDRFSDAKILPEKPIITDFIMTESENGEVSMRPTIASDWVEDVVKQAFKRAEHEKGKAKTY